MKQQSNMSLVILTKSPKFNWTDLKSVIKNGVKLFIGQKRGPDAVLGSLCSGLDAVGHEYKINPKQNEINQSETVFVNGSVAALRWAIEAKKQGKIGKLIVGPVMSILPSDHDSIMLNENIDLILFPSKWTRDFWLSKEKGLENKIKVWPAGVDIPELKESSKNEILIYYTKSDTGVFDYVKKYLDAKSIKYKVLYYGHYRQEKYFELLDKTKIAIFLSESESQGLAMFEAWARNVATLVWNRGYWQYGEFVWKDPQISSPFLTGACGKFFESEKEFVDGFESMFTGTSTFKPREYVINNFKNKKIAENFINLINQ